MSSSKLSDKFLRIDCIVINPSHPFTVGDEGGKASVIFTDAVDYVVEVKPDLSNDSEIERGLMQVKSVKRLNRCRNGLASTNEEKERAKKIPTFIFSNKTYVNIRTLIYNIVNYYIKNNVPKQEQFDMIVLNNRAIVFNVGKKAKLQYKDVEGIIVSETGEDTLALFLFYMNCIPKSEPEIDKNVLRIYLEKSDILNLYTMYCYEDLNAKLNTIESVL